MRSPSLVSCCLAELLGTFILVFFGCGVVHTAVLTGAQSGLWQVAIVWGLAVTLAIYVVGGVSGAHINPAMTLAFALWKAFPRGRVVPYWLSQLAGAVLAAWLLYVLFGPYLAQKEKEKGLVRGQPGSEITAMCYGEYFPNPGGLAAAPGAHSRAAHEQLNALVSEASAITAELIGTLILALVVFAVTDASNPAAPAGNLAPAFIGLTIAMLISVIAPLTQACFNPARDFGPRLVALFAGWGSIALPGPRGGWLSVYILAPFAGALLGGGLYELLIRPSFAVGQAEGSQPA